MVFLIDAATSDENKHWTQVVVCADGQEEAWSIAQARAEKELGEGFYPLLAFTSKDLETFAESLRSMEERRQCLRLQDIGFTDEPNEGLASV